MHIFWTICTYSYVRTTYYLSVYAYGVAELMYARAWALKVWLLVSFPPRSDRRIKSQGPLVMAKPGTFSKDIYYIPTTTTESLLDGTITVLQYNIYIE